MFFKKPVTILIFSRLINRSGGGLIRTDMKIHMNVFEQNRSEESLIREILNGDPELFRILVERHSPMVFYVVRKFIKDENEVQEMAQQIFVKTYEKLDRFTMNSKFSTWLYTLAMNHCRDNFKRVQRKNNIVSDTETELDGFESEERTPYLNLEMKEWKQRLKQALSHLKSEYSEPFLMKYRDEMSYELMAEKTGVSVGALKVRVHRARKELKELIDKEE